MTHWQFVFSLASLFVPAVSTAATDCVRIWSPAELAKEAKRLDGQLVCVRALLRPLPIRDRSSASLFVYEAVPVDVKQHPLDMNRLGLVDWDEELGIDGSLHRPESYDLIDGEARKCPGTPKDELSFEAEFRGIVEYRKGLTERAYKSLPPSLAPEAPRRTHYGTELVILEFLKVTGICRR
jgi:hypothetical protein